VLKSERHVNRTNKGTDRGDLAKLQGRRQGSNRGATTETVGNWQRPHKIRDLEKQRSNTEKCTTTRLRKIVEFEAVLSLFVTEHWSTVYKHMWPFERDC